MSQTRNVAFLHPLGDAQMYFALGGMTHGVCCIMPEGGVAFSAAESEAAADERAELWEAHGFTGVQVVEIVRGQAVFPAEVTA